MNEWIADVDAEKKNNKKDLGTLEYCSMKRKMAYWKDTITTACAIAIGLSFYLSDVSCPKEVFSSNKIENGGVHCIEIFSFNAITRSLVHEILDKIKMLVVNLNEASKVKHGWENPVGIL